VNSEKNTENEKHIIGSKSLTVCEKKNKKGVFDFLHNNHILQCAAKSVDVSGHGY
jgi:hypothetical protein